MKASTPETEIIQKIILLATGAPGATAFRQQLINLFEETGDFSLIADLIDSFLNQLTAENPKGIVGIIQAIANNGFSLNLSDQNAQQLALEFADQGIDSWSKLIAFILTDVKGDLASLLTNRAQAANHFTDLLTELNKENDYNGSQAINVAKEWIAGINASSTSFELANNTVEKLINRFFNGNVLGIVVDGKVANATVFIDENGDGILNPGELSTTTDSQGTFLFQGRLPEGQLISIGGTDTSTGLPINAVLSAPQGATFISPLTTLTNLIIGRGLAETPADAEQFLFTTLALAPADLSTFDPISLGLNPASPLEDQQTALKLQATTVQIIILINVFTTLINKIDNPGSSETTLAVFNGFIDALLEAQDNGIILDLTKPVVLANVITDATVAITPGDENEIRSIVKPLALVLADLNGRIQAALSGGDIQAAFAEIIKIQAFSQSILGIAVETLIDTGDTQTLVTEFTGNNLTIKLDGFNLPSALNDIDAPRLSGSLPVDDQLLVSVDSNITLFFNEDIQLGKGTIIISDGIRDTRIIDVTDNSQVTLNGGTLTLNPTQDLIANTQYSVQIESSVIRDIVGNNFAGIADDTTLNFTTDVSPTGTSPNPVDRIPPDLSATFPLNNATGQRVNSNIILDFNEIVVAATGNIIISNGTNDVRTISINDTSQVIFSSPNINGRAGANGSTITINPTLDLVSGNNYFVQIPSGVITDVAGNDFTGLSDTFSLSFTTAVALPPVTPPPPVTSPPPFNPPPPPFNSPFFNKAVQAGTGNIILSGGIDTRRTISINDPQVSISGNNLTITPNSKLEVSTLDNVQLANGVITDTGGTPFAEILKTNTLNFQKDGILDLSNVTPATSTTGFVINGISAFDQSDLSVSNTGDVNSDGLDDLIVGTFGDDPNGNSASGSSFVAFGKTDNLPIEHSVVEAGTGGFVINGDGIADLLVGASVDGNNGNLGNGASFVIFGGQGTTATISGIGNDTLIGDGTANQLVAGRGNDTLIGNGGADVLRGGAGDDILAISDLSFASIDGGTGNDVLRFDAGLSLDFTTTPDLKINSIESIDLLTDTSNNTVTLNITDVLNLSENQTAINTLSITANGNDTVILVDANTGQPGSWAPAGQSIGNEFEYTIAGRGIIGTVSIDLGVNVMII